MRNRSIVGACAVFVALAGATPMAGCQKKQLTEVEVPQEGVTLRYDLALGQAYGGHIKVRSATQTPAGEIVQRLEYDVDLVVTNKGSESSLVKATVNKIAFEQRLPDGIPESMLKDQGFSVETAESLNGVELRFHLGANGSVSEMPDPPEDASPGAQALIGFIGAGLQAGLPRVPSKAITQGESWDAVDPTRVGEGENASGTGKLEGLARDKGGQDLAKLAYNVEASGTRKTPLGNFDYTANSEIGALFSTGAGFPSQVDAKIKREAAGASVLMEISVKWSKLERRATSGEPEPESQAISDPCDPDYVGGEECPEDAAVEATE